MEQTQVGTLVGEFKAVHRRLRDRVESAHVREIEGLVKERQAIVERLFDHIRKKVDLPDRA